MTQSNENAVWMAPQAVDAIKAELEDLTGPQRAAVIERIASSREEGDLRENGGYHAAKEEQGKIESRIRQLGEWLRVSDTAVAPDDGIVGPGKLVTTEPRFSDDDKQEAFLLAVRVHDEGYPADLDVFSPQSPLGTALLGAKKGEVVSYRAPNGRDVKVTILDVHPYSS